MCACTARGAASPRTREAYEAALRRFLAWCEGAGVDAAAACRQDIEAYRAAELAAGAAPGTVMLRLSAVRTLYKALVRAGRRQDNPAEHVKSPRQAAAAVDRVMRKFIPAEQMKVVLGQLGESVRGLRDRALLLAMYLLGLRVSEVQGLDWEDWKGDTLAFRAKGAQARELAVPEGLKAAFARLREATGCGGPMFIGETGRMSVRGIQKMVGVRLGAAGRAPAGRGGSSPHAMRHSCATVAAINGASIYAIQDQCGHADLRSTSIYTKAAGRMMGAPSLAVEKALGI